MRSRSSLARVRKPHNLGSSPQVSRAASLSEGSGCVNDGESVEEFGSCGNCKPLIKLVAQISSVSLCGLVEVWARKELLQAILTFGFEAGTEHVPLVKTGAFLEVVQSL